MSTDIKRIIDYNKPEFNYIKLAEELAELQEVIIKRYTKKEKNRPPIDKVIEEMGDVLLRLKVLAQMENINTEVNLRFKTKMEKLIGYIDKNKYKGGI